MVEGGDAMNDMDLTAAFNYAALGADAEIVRGCANRIHARMKKSVEHIVEIGIELRSAKKRLPKGCFGEWLDIEFDWSEPTARRFMAVADRFEGSNQIDRLGASVLYMLASDSVPAEAVAEAIELSKAEPVTVAKAKEIIERHKPEPAEPAELEGPGNACDIPADDGVIETDDGVEWNREPPKPPSNVATIWRELQAKLDTFEAIFEKSAQDCYEAQDVMTAIDKLQDRYGYYVRNVEGG
jgi:hypothetical protein